MTVLSRVVTWIQRTADLLFGYDFFISYAHSDGLEYPRKLADELQSKGFRVFLDSRVYVAGDDLRLATRRRIRMSKYLILIVRPAAVHSRWVLTELQRCLDAGRKPIAINVNGTLEQTTSDNQMKQLLKDKLFIAESLKRADESPSADTIEKISRSFKVTRQDALRARVMAAAAAVLIAVTAIAGWQYQLAERRERQAREQQALRYVANAERQLFQNPQQGLLLAAQGLSEGGSENAIGAATNAIRAALEVIKKRQEIQEDSSWGSNPFQSYIAGAWFEADLNARYNEGGDLLLLTTERGTSGPNPPGDAFLLKTETLEMKELDIGPAWGSKREGPGVIGTFRVRPDTPPNKISFVCTVHEDELGVLKVGDGDSEARIVARDGDGGHWTRAGRPVREVVLSPGASLTFEIETGQHGLTFLDKDQALGILDLDESLVEYGYQLRIPSRREPKRRLEYVGFGETGRMIYLARQYNVEVYSADGAFEKEFDTGGGCTKYPISLVTGVMGDRLIVYGDTDGGVYGLHYATGRCFRIAREYGRILIKFDLSPSGQFAALVFRDRTAAVWKVDETAHLQTMLAVPNHKVLIALFNPQTARQLLTAGEDGLVSLWEIQGEAFRQIRTYQHMGGPVGFAAYSEDGNRIVAVDTSNNVYIWDSVTGELLRSIEVSAPE